MLRTNWSVAMFLRNYWLIKSLIDDVEELRLPWEALSLEKYTHVGENASMTWWPAYLAAHCTSNMLMKSEHWIPVTVWVAGIRPALPTSLIWFFHIETPVVWAFPVQSEIICSPVTGSRLPLYQWLLLKCNKTDLFPATVSGVVYLHTLYQPTGIAILSEMPQ